MLRKVGRHLRDQWMGATALFLVLCGGTAYAANTIGSTDIINNQVYGADVRDDSLAGGGLGNVDLKAGAVRSSEVASDSLTGADIADQSGVDTCVVTNRIGQLCVRAENSNRTWINALGHCANLDLRLPTLAEAVELGQIHDIPNVDPTESFWTDEIVNVNGGFYSYTVTEEPTLGVIDQTAQRETLCVTTPTN